jgi:hypothetical protein
MNKTAVVKVRDRVFIHATGKTISWPLAEVEIYTEPVEPVQDDYPEAMFRGCSGPIFRLTERFVKAVRKMFRHDIKWPEHYDPSAFFVCPHMVEIKWLPQCRPRRKRRSLTSSHLPPSVTCADPRVRR